MICQQLKATKNRTRQKTKNISDRKKIFSLNQVRQSLPITCSVNQENIRTKLDPFLQNGAYFTFFQNFFQVYNDKSLFVILISSFHPSLVFLRKLTLKKTTPPPLSPDFTRYSYYIYCKLLLNTKTRSFLNLCNLYVSNRSLFQNKNFSSLNPPKMLTV